MILIFYFRFGQGSSTGNGPINGLLASVNKPLLNEGREGLENLRLVTTVHGTIFAFPIRQEPQAVGIVCAGSRYKNWKNLCMPCANQTVKIFLLLSQGFRHLVLDWQTVTIPTRNIRCPESAGRFESKNRILQNFVQCRSDVNVSVRKRRTIVQHERFAALFFSCIRAYIFRSFQWSMRTGSLSTAFARIGKSVLGRLRVSLSFSAWFI